MFIFFPFIVLVSLLLKTQVSFFEYTAKKICLMMDAMFDICYLSSDGNSVEPDDIPKTKEHVWVLGKKYSAIQGL